MEKFQRSVAINKLLIFLVSVIFSVLLSVIYTMQEPKHIGALLYGYLFGDVILNNNSKSKLRINPGINFLFLAITNEPVTDLKVNLSYMFVLLGNFIEVKRYDISNTTCCGRNVYIQFKSSITSMGGYLYNLQSPNQIPCLRMREEMKSREKSLRVSMLSR